jgi:hypothetical protein
MNELVSSPDLRERLGRAARAKIERDAEPDAHRARLMTLITQVARHV